MTADERADLRRLALAATPGERHVAVYNSGADVVTYAVHYPPDDIGYRWSNAAPTLADAEFHAATDPAAVLSLLNALEEAEREVARLHVKAGAFE